MADSSFLDIVQLHERVWGTNAYPGRPTLAELLNAPVVAMWVESQRTERRIEATRRTLTDEKGQSFKLACYKTPDELNQALLSVLVLGKGTMLLGRQLSKVWLNGRLVRITGVQLIIEQA